MSATQTSRLPDAAWNPQTAGSAGATGRAEEGEASVRPTPGERCSYAHCSELAVRVDGAPGFRERWPFCKDHFREHRALFHGATWPNTRHVDPETRQFDLRPHGTPAAIRRHQRRAEPLCEQCCVCRQEQEAALRRQQAKPVHGTRAGYKRHRRNKTKVCEPCRNAEAEYQRGRYRERREAS